MQELANIVLMLVELLLQQETAKGNDGETTYDVNWEFVADLTDIQEDLIRLRRG